MSVNYSLSSPSLLPLHYRKIGWSGGSVPCDNSIYGCTTRTGSQEQQLQHKQECQYEPSAMIKCDECDSELKRSERKYHNCITEMRSSLKNVQQLMDQLQQKVDEQSTQLNQVKQKLNQLESVQHKCNCDHSDGSTEGLIEKQAYNIDNGLDDKQTNGSNQQKAQFVETKG